MDVLALSMVILLAMAGYSSAGNYCVCNSGLGDSQLQQAIDYACGAGADCTQIKDNGPCFSPNTVKDHCNFAVNSYFQKKGQSQGSCDFSGIATVSQTAPPGATSACYSGNPSSSSSTPAPPGSGSGSGSSTGSGSGSGTGSGTGSSTGTSTGSGTGSTGSSTGTGTGTSTGSGTGSTGMGTGTGSTGAGTSTGINTNPSFGGLGPSGTTTGINDSSWGGMSVHVGTVGLSLLALFVSGFTWLRLN